MGSGAMLYILNLIKTDSRIEKLMGDTKAHIEHAHHIRLLSFFHNKKHMLKTPYRVSYSLAQHRI
jgi:hypothetical protein